MANSSGIDVLEKLKDISVGPDTMSLSDFADKLQDLIASNIDTSTLLTLLADAITASEIKAGAVGTSELATDAVNAAKIEAGAVGTPQLATNSVTAVKITDGVITPAKMAAPKLNSYKETFAFGDMTDNLDATGEFVLTVTIPAKAVFLQAAITDVTGFAGDTSAVMTIGDGSDVDRYNTGTPDVFSTVVAAEAGTPSGLAAHATAVNTVTVTVTSGSDFGLVSAGQATITLFWLETE